MIASLKMLQTQFVLCIFLFTSLGISIAQDEPKLPIVESITLDQWMEELSNWGRWGEHDELGTLNLITPEKRIQAARLVRQGKNRLIRRV